MTINHTVSVIIAAFNAGATIKRAILSALAEPETKEVIVVDDGSTDDTLLMTHSAEDGSGRLRVISLTANKGPSFARNQAIEMCKGEWICVLDSDDFFLPGRMKRMLSYASKAELIADDIWQAPENEVNQPRRKLVGNTINMPCFISLFDFVMLSVTHQGREGHELSYIKPIMKRSFIENHKIRYKEHMRLGEDYELYVNLLACGAGLFLVPVQGYVSVIRKGSLSHNHTVLDLLNLRDCNNHLALLPSLTSKEKHALRQNFLSIDCRLQWRLLILAVRQHEFKKGVATFFRPFPVPIYLLKQLFKQLILSSRGKCLHKL